MTLLSYTKKFIFIHNYKVAGSSIKKALHPYDIHCDKRYKVLSGLGMAPKFDQRTTEPHRKALEIRNFIGATTFNQYFTFGFVRNPWDWQVSLYHYMKKTKVHHQHSLINSMNGFNEYIKWRLDNIDRYQKDFFTDEEEKVIVDFIGRYENLVIDFDKITRRIGIKKSLPHVNESKRSKSSFIAFYTQETLDMIEEAYQPDIEFFGYSKPVLPQ